MQWIETLFGVQNSSFQLAIMIGVVAVAIAIVFFLYRLFLRRRLRLPKGARTRQPRLGLVDAYSLDGQRQLVLVRRDNIEHLVMIGGPNDVLLESQIVRSAAAPPSPKEREPTAAAPKAVTVAPALVKPSAPARTAPEPAKAGAAPEAATSTQKRPAEVAPRPPIPAAPPPVRSEAAKGEAIKPEPPRAPLASNLPPPLERPTAAKPAPAAPPPPRPAPAEAAAVVAAPAGPPAAKPAPAAPKADEIETLEAEMARLLGRSP